MVDLVTVVMTHPAREAAFDALLARLLPQCREVLEECDETSAGSWPTARRAWLLGSVAGGSHVLLLQDDARVCADLLDTVRALVTARPEAAISLHGRHGPLERARGLGLHWLASRGLYTGIAHVLPTAWVVEMLAWLEAQPRRERWPERSASDTRFVDYVREVRKAPLYVPVPNPVDHGDLPSLMPNSRPSAYWKSPVFAGEDARLAGRQWNDLVALCECGKLESTCRCA